MSGWVVGSAYGVSVGLLIYGMSEEIIAEEHRFMALLVWAAAGLYLAFKGTEPSDK